MIRKAYFLSVFGFWIEAKRLAVLLWIETSHMHLSHQNVEWNACKYFPQKCSSFMVQCVLQIPQPAKKIRASRYPSFFKGFGLKMYPKAHCLKWWSPCLKTTSSPDEKDLTDIISFAACVSWIHDYYIVTRITRLTILEIRLTFTFFSKRNFHEIQWYWRYQEMLSVKCQMLKLEMPLIRHQIK
jgi:hypothetical protein